MIRFKKWALAVASGILLTISAQAQTATDSTKKAVKKYQARAPKTQPFGASAFESSTGSTIRWLGFAGFFVNSRGTTFMVDPVLEGFDMPVLVESPITPKAVPRLDAVLITHSDNDHFSIPTCRDLSAVTKAYHSTVYVDSLMKNESYLRLGMELVICSGLARYRSN